MAALSPLWARAAGRSFPLLQSVPFPLLPSRLQPKAPSVLCRVAVPAWNSQQIRGKTRGNEYQPNTWKRKKTHGWIRRIRTPGGVAVILRRLLKGRRSLSP